MPINAGDRKVVIHPTRGRNSPRKMVIHIARSGNRSSVAEQPSTLLKLAALQNSHPPRLGWE